MQAITERPLEIAYAHFWPMNSSDSPMRARTFGVAEDDPGDVVVHEHLRRDLARVSAALADPAVLRGERVLAVQGGLHPRQVHHGRGADDLDVGGDLSRVEILHQLLDARGVAVALPVAADHEAAGAGHRGDASPGSLGGGSAGNLIGDGEGGDRGMVSVWVG
jgi:hypothetical protein